MKRLLLLYVFLLFLVYSVSQEVQFPPSIISAGGGPTVTNTEHIAKWRIGYVNVFYIVSEDLKSSPYNDINEDKGIEINVYPNPVITNVYIQFNIDEKSMVNIEITDIAGEKVYFLHNHIVIPGQVISLNLSELSTKLYLLRVTSIDNSINKVFKINKQ